MPESSSSDGLLASAPRLVRRHLALVGVLTVSGLLLGLLLGFTRPAKYQAESKLLVGVFDAPADAIPGYVLAAQNIAADYARVANSPAVQNPLADQLGVSVAELPSLVTVTAIPQSAVLRVVATSTSEDRAVTVASATADALTKAVDGLNTTGPNDALLGEYTDAAKALAEATVARDSAKRQVAASAAPSQAAQDDLRAKQLAVDTATVREQGLKQSYTDSQKQSSTTGQIRTLGEPIAQRASSYTTLIYAAVGLAAGLLLGLFLARRRERSSLALEASAAESGGEWVPAETIGTSP